jgi:hypothetical protein
MTHLKKKTMPEAFSHPSSFRDPAGFVFFYQGKFYRHIHSSYADHYKALMAGPYQNLISRQLLIPHDEIQENISGESDLYLTILPKQIDLISYPYEWCFDQLKDTALVCMEIMRISIDHGLILKDATPFNFQLLSGKPMLIDSLSFEQYDPGLPWIAYRQFCEGFLFPLMINHYLGQDFQQLLALYPDGIPASLAAKILPWKSRFSLGAWLHVFLQDVINKKGKAEKASEISFSKPKMLRMIEHLHSIISALKFHSSSGQDWSGYYQEAHDELYSFEKLKIFKIWLGEIEFASALDLGTNLGTFANALADKASRVVATDMDNRCINQLYLSMKISRKENMHPLITDLVNPPASGGFRNAERKSFSERARSDLVAALAIVHHLVLIRNIPFEGIASYCAELAQKFLIIEFVPITDPKVQLMISGKKIFHQPYNAEAFENAFAPYFLIEASVAIPGSERILYKMKKIRA